MRLLMRSMAPRKFPPEELLRAYRREGLLILSGAILLVAVGALFWNGSGPAQSECSGRPQSVDATWIPHRSPYGRWCVWRPPSFYLLDENADRTTFSPMPPNDPLQASEAGLGASIFFGKKGDGVGDQEILSRDPHEYFIFNNRDLVVTYLRSRELQESFRQMVESVAFRE